jgi:hypothetical protein
MTLAVIFAVQKKKDKKMPGIKIIDSLWAGVTFWDEETWGC